MATELRKEDKVKINSSSFWMSLVQWTLSSPDDKLSENIWFVCLELWRKVGCHNRDRQTVTGNREVRPKFE